MKQNMSWGQRFALIDHYNPADTAICMAFGLSQDELETARMMRQSGALMPSADFDVSKYATIFTAAPAAGTEAAPKKGTATVHAKPESASKRVKEPQKRGRKGDKIQRALQAVPTQRVPVTTFMSTHDVSLAVLRQSKRFIGKLDAQAQASIGKINVRLDKTSKQLMIWREPA